MAVPPLLTVEVYQLLPLSVSTSFPFPFSVKSFDLQFSRSSQERKCLESVLIFQLFIFFINKLPSNNYTLNLIQKIKWRAFIKFYCNPASQTPMQKGHIEDLSAIIQKKSYEESQMTYEQSKPAPNIRCPQNNRENYQCMICNRLRQVCPYTKLTHCLHEGRQRGVYKSDYFMEKSNLSTLAGERMRTLSHQEPYKNAEQSRSREYRQIHNIPPRIIETRPVILPQQTHTHITVTPPSEVIYYPVIHNRYVVSPAVDKSTGVTGTPKRMAKSRRVDYDEEVILTPTQIKEMLYSYKQ